MNRSKYKVRRIAIVLAALAGFGWYLWQQDQESLAEQETNVVVRTADKSDELALDGLARLEVKGRAPKTGYAREEFGSGWGQIGGCDARNVILQRDLTETELDGCLVLSGKLLDPYTGKTIAFSRSENSSAVQIDHVVALSDAWQKGAQYWEKPKRVALANDPLELLASDGPANQQKGDGDAATWLPPNKAFRCDYVSRQITIKLKYQLWVTEAEKEAMQGVLQKCREEKLVKY